jgi:hypothetical protein
MRASIYLGVFVVAMLAMAPSAYAEQRYAVVIGANPGWSSDRPLRFAENDAERVRDVLVSFGEFAPDRVVLLRDPDTAEVRATLRDLERTAKASGEDTLVFVYYSGHADNERLHLKGDPLTFKELQSTLRGMSATIKLAVIDACKSGAVTHKGGARVNEFAVSIDNPKLSGMVLLTSSGADELSQESRALAGSVFTHHLVSGLRGAADDNGDKQVTIAEAYRYAYGRTQADTASSGTPQRPSFRYELSGQGELVLAYLKATNRSARIKVPKGAGTKYVVLDQHEWRLVAEARADKDRDVELALAPGNYKVKKVFADRLEVGSLVLAAGEKALADNITYKSAPLAQGVVKGSPDDLAPEDKRHWQRDQAFGLLAQGQANAALTMFDQLVKDEPQDLLAWRGRARSLVRLAEAYQRVNDHMRERLSLNDALKADPTLAEDPSFKLWYQRLGELDARAATSWEAQMKLKRDEKQNPRTSKRWGLGFDIVSGRGAAVVVGSVVLAHSVIPRIALDAAGPGLDAGVVLAPLPKRWSPFLGIGGHLSFAEMGIGEASTAMGTVNGESFSYDEVYGRHVRAEVGAQFVGRSGFSTELGLAFMMFKTREGERASQVMPILHFGWLW